ncbi:CCA tRNA nucleotidyltransferase [Chloroflexota bacterium]
MKLFIEPSVSSLLIRVSHFFSEHGVKAYLTGGLVRDMLLGRETADIDIAVATDAPEIAPGVAKALDGKDILLDEVNRISRVVLENETAATKSRWELDFSTFEGDIEQDLARRDFTINAMAIDLEEFVRQPQSPVLIDPFHGQDDLNNGAIRVISESTFISDPARLLRAVRLTGELGFSIDNETETLIQRYSNLIASVAGERIREELLQLLAMPQTGQLLSYLDELDLLTAIIPELAQMKGVSQPKIHVWDVFDHSIETVATICFLLREGTLKYAGKEVLAAVPRSVELEQHFNQEVSSGSTRSSLLKLAALLHDIAKPQTKSIDEDGRARFLGHAKEGATTATGILERLRFSTKEIKLVEALISHHLRPTQMSQKELPSRRAIYRYFRDTGGAGVDILFLSLADHLATRGSQLYPSHWQQHTQLVAYVMAKRFEEDSLTVPPKLIDGNDLIKDFGLSPGPEVGEILEAVREAQAAGEVTTREEALTQAERLLASHSLKR